MSRTVPLLDLSSLVFSMILQLRHSPPFPYTTLFRSFCSSGASSPAAYAPAKPSTSTIRPSSANRRFLPAGLAGGGGRSEEHTSELQSLRHLVCRLLLEKKKEKKSRRSRRLTNHKCDN